MRDDWRQDRELRDRLRHAARMHRHGLQGARGPARHWHPLFRDRDFAIRFFVNRSLQRRIFGWFGVTILATGSVVFAVMRTMAHGSVAHGPPTPARGIAALVVWMLCVWGASGFLARRLSRPVTDIVRVAEEFGGGNLDARVAVNTRGRHHPDETVIVARAFNTMAARLQKQISDQQTLLAAVSHELRTPLARMNFLTERVRAGDPLALGSIEDEVKAIDALVGDLLASARIDFSAKERTLVEASDLALRAIETTSEDPTKLAVTRKVRLRADATLVVRALVNLVENARRHGGGLVELCVDEKNGAVVFTVDDDGEGMAEGESVRVFDAFYKNPKTPDAKAASSGLGLALVRRIAEWHGGTVTAENRIPRGARFMLTLPAA